MGGKERTRKVRKLLRSVKRFFTIPVETTHLRSKTVNRLSFTFEYGLMLIASTVISTLGLLMNSSAIIIGGMILSPLMIPIFSLSYGIYAGKIQIMQRSLTLLVVSIAVAVGIAVLTTELSPLKNITEEITIRTTPNLLDMIIALSAGLIGILVLTREKIADSFAGVAIATSLVPPLSVAGIGLALSNPQVYYGGFLLFLLNILAITAIGTVYLIGQHWLAVDKTQFSMRALVIIFISLTLLALPLTYQLSTLSNTITIESKAREVIQGIIADTNPNAQIDYIETNVSSSEPRLVSINARITVDERDVVAYELQEALERQLKQALGSNINLQLNIQRTVSIASKEQVRREADIKSITDSFSKKLKHLYPQLTINNITIDRDSYSGNWLLTARLSGKPEDSPTKHDLNKIKKDMADEFMQKILYDVSYTPSIQLVKPTDIVY